MERHRQTAEKEQRRIACPRRYDRGDDSYQNPFLFFRILAPQRSRRGEPNVRQRVK